MPHPEKIELVIHGHKIELESHLPEVLEDFRHDFYYFTQKTPSDWLSTFRISLQPASQRPKHWKALWSNKRSTLFWGNKNERRVAFFKRAWVSYQAQNRRAILYCDDPKTGYEATYLVTLSVIGETLDCHKQHRIHGLGFAHDDTGAILLAPSGRCKSTLALHLLDATPLSLLSDDTPILTHQGEMLAFPQRIAVKERPRTIPDRYLRIFQRHFYGAKFVVGSEYFLPRIEKSSRVNWLVLTTRGAETATIHKLPKWRAWWPLLKWQVIGYETPQIWELFIRPSAKDLIIKIKILGWRILCSLRLLRNVQVAQLTLSNCPRDTLNALTHFLFPSGESPS